MPNCLARIEYDSHATLRKVRGNGYIGYQNREYLVGEAFKGRLIEIKEDEVNGCVNIYFGQRNIYTYDLIRGD